MPPPDPAPRAPSNREYPTSAAHPRAETDLHRAVVGGLRQALASHFTDPFVTVASDLLVFYVPGDRRRHVLPDLFVVRGVAPRERPNYLVWEEGKGPDFVLEVVTPASRAEDTEEKLRLYRDVLLVPEYFLFDPEGDALTPPLQGYRLEDTEYQPIEPVAGGRLPSDILGLHLRAEGGQLRFYDPAAGRWLPSPDELTARSVAERERAELEQQWVRIEEQRTNAGRALTRASQAQAEASQAQAEAAQRQAEAARVLGEAQRLQDEARRALELAARRQAAAAAAQEEAARQWAEFERLREQVGRQAAEAEVQRLRRELEFLRRPGPSGGTPGERGV